MKVIVSCIAILALMSCSENHQEVEVVNHQPDINSQEYLMAATLYTQSSAEYVQLCKQAYDLAGIKLMNNLKEDLKNPAVVLDLDETVLDNSAYTAWQIESGNGYGSETWMQWLKQRKATLIPGVKNFLDMADQLGVTIFYVSNRPPQSLNVTIENMTNLDLPQLEEDHFYLKDGGSDKSMRRRSIVDKGYDVLLYVGDNLADFDHVFDKGSPDERKLAVDSLDSEMEDRFVLLPNVLYGTWMGAIHQHSYDWTEAELKQNRLNNIKATTLN